MKITKEGLRDIITRKREETKRELLKTNGKKPRIKFSKKGELKKINLDYEVFLQ